MVINEVIWPNDQGDETSPRTNVLSHALVYYSISGKFVRFYSYVYINIIVMFWPQIQAILWWYNGNEPTTYTEFLSKHFCSCLQLKATVMCMH